MSCFTQEASRKLSDRSPFFCGCQPGSRKISHHMVIKMVIKSPASFGHEHLFNMGCKMKFPHWCSGWNQETNDQSHRKKGSMATYPRYNTWKQIHVTFFHWWKKSCYQPGMRTKPVVNNGISNYQAQLVATGFLFTSRTYEKTWDHFGLVLVFW